jgi:outer membrane cobalamin receptor
VSPLIGVTLSRSDRSGSTNYSLEYAATSQLPGYTALNSNPSGLFGGNPLLGREKAKQLSVSVERDGGNWQMQATLFSRRDDSLVDWTYATDAPFSRQANAVDIDVVGFEALFVRSWDALDLAVGYTALDKDADYGTAQVDASFYALNFAKQRATLALVYRFASDFEFRLDNEYRSQEDNPLRVGDDSTYLASVSLRWVSPADQRLGVALIVDNVTDSEYQPFPGTPASGRQLSLSGSYSW